MKTTTRMFAAAALIALSSLASRADDPYIEGDGTCGISTGYRMNGSSKVEVDFALPDVSNTSEWNECRIFGTDNSTYEPSLQTCLYATYTASNGNKFFRVRTKVSGSDSQPTKYRSGVDTSRHTVIFDLPNAKMVFLSGSSTNGYAYADGGANMTTDAGVSFTGLEATLPLSLFGRFSNTNATKFSNCAKARIYGVKIYEDGSLVHDFVPCKREGTTPCFKDLAGGGFIVGENVAAFTASDNAPAYEDNPYVSTDNGGKLFIDTGYNVTSNTAVELDCALTRNFPADNTSFWHLFDYDDAGVGARFGFNFGHNGLRFNAEGNSYVTTLATAFPKPLDDKEVRRTFILDNHNLKAQVVTSGFTNQTATYARNTSAVGNGYTLKIAAANYHGNGNHAPIKIYGLKIYEKGVPVRDYEPFLSYSDGVETPVLRDRIHGTVLAATDYAGTGAKLAYGGRSEAYIESSGSTSGISTGYRMKGTSKVEVDFALATTNSSENWRVFGTDYGSLESTLKTCLYVSGNTYFAMKSESSSAVVKYRTGVDTDRHTAIFDLPASKMVFVTDGVTNSYAAGSTGGNTTPDAGISFYGEATLPLSLFAGFYNGQATTFANVSKTRIYGVKIYEDGEIVRNFVPCLREGTTPCFKDLVTGAFIVGEDISKFTASGDAAVFPDDGYVSTAANADGGMLYIDTGYKTTEKSAVAIDCALTVNTNLGGSIWRLFQEGASSIFDFNLNGNYGLRYQVAGTYKTDFTTAFKDTLYDDKDVRRTFYLYNSGKAAVATAGFTNQTATFTQTASISHGYSLKLAANWAGNNDFAAIKIYGCKIWEDGVLVRDFVPYVNYGTPCLLDRKTGAVKYASRGSGDTSSELVYGGVITQDAYIESDGASGFSTGYCVKDGVSRVEMDFALSTTESCQQWRIFGSDTPGGDPFNTCLYIDGSKHWAFKTEDATEYPPSGTPTVCDTDRHTAIIDHAAHKYRFVTKGVTNELDTGVALVEGRAAEYPLPLLTRWANGVLDDGSHDSCKPANAKIYSVRIYETEGGVTTLVHEFLPYSKGGVKGLFDTKTGNIITAANSNAFAFDGAGQDNGQFKSYTIPPETLAAPRRPATLTAYGPGAAYYHWFKSNGDPVPGGTDGSLTVTWVRSYNVAEYYSVAFYDIGGEYVEGEPSVPARVVSAPCGILSVFK